MRFDNNSLSLISPVPQEHIYKLMKSDSYARFLRSNAYQDLLLAKKKVPVGKDVLASPSTSWFSPAACCLCETENIVFFFVFFSFKKGMSTFVFFTGGMASMCAASAWVLGKTWWPKVKVVWKDVDLAQLSPELSAGNTNCIASFSWKRQYVIWGAEPINLFITGAKSTY